MKFKNIPNICRECMFEFYATEEKELCPKCFLFKKWRKMKKEYDPQIALEIKQVYLARTKTYRKL